MTTTVYVRLVAACKKHDPKFKAQGAKEANEAYLVRILSVVSEVPQADYDALGADAHAWFDDAGAAVNAKKPSPFPEGFKDNDGDESGDEGEGTESGDEGGAAEASDGERADPADAVAKTKAKGKAAAKTDKPKAAAKVKVPPAPKDKSKSVTYQLRLIFAKNPAITAEEALKEIHALGFKSAKTSTVTTILYDARTVLDALKEVGWAAPKK